MRQCRLPHPPDSRRTAGTDGVEDLLIAVEHRIGVEPGGADAGADLFHTGEIWCQAVQDRFALQRNQRLDPAGAGILDRQVSQVRSFNTKHADDVCPMGSVSNLVDCALRLGYLNGGAWAERPAIRAFTLPLFVRIVSSSKGRWPRSSSSQTQPIVAWPHIDIS